MLFVLECYYQPFELINILYFSSARQRYDRLYQSLLHIVRSISAATWNELHGPVCDQDMCVWLGSIVLDPWETTEYNDKWVQLSSFISLLKWLWWTGWLLMAFIKFIFFYKYKGHMVQNAFSSYCSLSKSPKNHSN